jgi:hypothetical protein
MNPNLASDAAVRDRLQLELTEAAFTVTSRYEVQGSVVDQKMDLWNALGRVFGERAGGRARREDLIAEATDAAYRVALDRGFQGPFLDLELDLWRNLCRVIRRSGVFGRGRPQEHQDC